MNGELKTVKFHEELGSEDVRQQTWYVVRVVMLQRRVMVSVRAQDQVAEAQVKMDLPDSPVLAYSYMSTIIGGPRLHAWLADLVLDTRL